MIRFTDKHNYRCFDLALFDPSYVPSESRVELRENAGEFERKRVQHSFESIALKIVVVEKVGQRLAQLLDITT